MTKDSRRSAEYRRQYENLRALNEIAALPRVGAEEIVAGLRLGAGHLGLELAILSRIEGDAYTIQHHHAPDAAPLSDGMVFDLGVTYCSMTLRADDVVAISNMGDSEHAGHPCYGAFQLEAYIGAPVIVRGRRHGTVNFSSATPYHRPFEQGDLEFMRLLASWVGAALERMVADEELARSNRELERFAYAVSHDLRQPLRTVTSYLQLLARGSGDRLDDEGREFLAFALGGAQRMNLLIGGLLDISRMGRSGGSPEPLDLGALVDRVLEGLASLIGETGAVVTVDGELPTITGEAVEIHRLFQNLIENAVKYRRAAASPRITVSAARRRNVWEITVADNGRGVAAVDRERVFGVFQRGADVGAEEGAGIGLAMCRKIAEFHGGSLVLAPDGEGTSGKGSRFVVTLPA